MEVTVREQTGHSQTINNLMELSFIKEKEKPNKSGIISKIQRKIQQTKESMKKILHKSNPSTNDRKKASGMILDFEEENQKNLNELNDPSNNEEFIDNENEEAEELKLSKKKVSIYLNNKKIECEESLILSPDTEEKIPEVKEELEIEMLNDEGISELKRINLNKNVINNHNHLKFQFANIVDIYCPSNSNEKIGEVMNTVSKMNSKNEENKEIPENNSKDFNKNNVNHQIITNITNNEKSSSANFLKKKGGFKKSVSINPEQIKTLPKIVLFEEPGKFNLGKNKIF